MCLMIRFQASEVMVRMRNDKGLATRTERKNALRNYLDSLRHQLQPLKRTLMSPKLIPKPNPQVKSHASYISLSHHSSCTSTAQHCSTRARSSPLLSTPGFAKAACKVFVRS